MKKKKTLIFTYKECPFLYNTLKIFEERSLVIHLSKISLN